METKELSIERYNEELKGNLEKSSYLYSISNLSPEKWIENEVNEYVTQILSSIKNRKNIYRITLIDDKEKFEYAFIKQIKKGYVDYAKKYLNNNSLEAKIDEIKNLKEFKRLSKELLKDTLVVFGIIHSNIDDGAYLIWKNKNLNIKAESKQTISNALVYMGNSYEEILIYDSKLCCVKYINEKTVKLDYYKDIEYVKDATAKWNALKENIKEYKIKGISVHKYLQSLDIDMSDETQKGNYLSKYQPPFSNNNNNSKRKSLLYAAPD
jgi:hypothetical protein